jgi:methylthioribose-1-phosphate isomerase
VAEDVDSGTPDASLPPVTDRRAFLRSMGRSTVHSTVQVAAVLDAVRRAPGRLVSSLDFGPRDTGADAAADPGDAAPVVTVAEPAPTHPAVIDGSPAAAASASDQSRHHQPYRLDVDGIHLVDQRELPGRIHELQCPSAASVVAAIQAFAVGGGPVVGEVAAEAVALAARTGDASADDRERSRVGWTIGMLRSARPSSAYLKAALDAVEEALDDERAGPLVGSLQARAAAAADRVAAETAAACDRLAQVGAAALARQPDRLRVLTIGATGAMSGGGIGTVTGILAERHRERGIHAWIAEARPTLLGARIGTVELERAGVPFGLVADSTAGALMAAADVDVVLVAAERVAANGDVAAIAGSYGLAALARRHGIPFHVCAIRAAFDGSVPDGAACPTDRLPIQTLTSYRGARIATTGGDAWVPWLDVTPSELVTSFFTEDGVVS